MNLAALRGRLRRVRIPHGRGPSAGITPATALAVGGGFIVLVALSMGFLDIVAWEWARELPREVKDAFRIITRFGKSDWLLIPTGVFGLALLAADFDRIRADVAAAWVEIGHAIFFFFVATAGAGLTTNLVKILVGRARPHSFRSDGHLAFNPVVFDSYQWSLPSGHATTAAAAAAAVALIVQRVNAFTVTVTVAAAVIAVSRVPLRVHYVSDVFVGAFVGLTVTYAIAWLLGRTGVVFQRQINGALLPKTVVVRTLAGRPAGIMPLAAGLLRLGSGPPPRSPRGSG